MFSNPIWRKRKKKKNSIPLFQTIFNKTNKLNKKIQICNSKQISSLKDDVFELCIKLNHIKLNPYKTKTCPLLPSYLRTPDPQKELRLRSQGPLVAPTVHATSTLLHFHRWVAARPPSTWKLQPQVRLYPPSTAKPCGIKAPT